MTNNERQARLVQALKRSGSIKTPTVEAALLAVARERFLPETPITLVYSDTPVPIKRCDGVIVSGSSQPTMMAVMLELLCLRPGHRVLEIGAGTGYNAALLQELVGQTGHVVTVDVDEDIVERAKLGLRESGYGAVQAVCKDGSLGFAEAAPYDRVVLTVGAWDIAPAWIDQLKAEGILLMPLWLAGVEVMVAFRRDGDALVSTSMSRCAFMRLRGLMSGPEGSILLDAATDLTLDVEDRQHVDAAATAALLDDEPRDTPLPVGLASSEFADFAMWLALRHAGYCAVSMNSKRELETPVTWPVRMGTFRRTFGLRDDRGICLLSRTAIQNPDSPVLRQFGDAARLVDTVANEIHQWDTAGRPSVEQHTVTAYPRGHAPVPGPDEWLIDKMHTALLITRPV